MPHTIFSVQIHYGKRSGIHWDLRVLMPDHKVWSWAIPKQKMPEIRGEKLLAVWVDDTHSRRYMTFEGTLPNGEKVELYDYGMVIIHKFSKFRLMFEFKVKKISGMYQLIKTDPNWLILKTQ